MFVSVRSFEIDISASCRSSTAYVRAMSRQASTSSQVHHKKALTAADTTPQDKLLESSPLREVVRVALLSPLKLPSNIQLSYV